MPEGGAQSRAQVRTEPAARPAVWLIGLARVLTRIFFRRIDVVGADRVPPSGPLLVVANHHNSLVDPALLLASLPRPARFLAKSTLWQIPGLRRLLDAAASIPVYRRQDTGEDMARNRETFERCHEVLAAGGVVALFPEGISHDAPRLAELRTGAARIALEAGARFAPLRLRILAVGLVFDMKGKFRSRALLRVGESFEPRAEQTLHEKDPQAAVRALTARIRAALEEVTLNYPEQEEPSVIDRAGEVWAVEEKPLPARMALAEAFALRRGVIAAYRRLREVHPERVAQARELVQRYEGDFRRLGLRDDHVAASYATGPLLIYLAGTLALLLFWLPLAGVGMVLNQIPYRLVDLVASRAGKRDLPATYKLMGGFVFYPVAWILQAALVGWLFGADAALDVLVLCPVTGWVAMLFHERYEHFFGEALAYARLMLRRRSLGALRADRAALRRRLRELAALDRRTPPPLP